MCCSTRGIRLARQDVATHTPSHRLTVPHRWHLRLAAIRTELVRQVVRMLIGINDRLVLHGLGGCSELVCRVQRVPKRGLIPCSTPFGNPEHFDTIDTFGIQSVEISHIPLQLFGDLPIGLRFLPAGLHCIDQLPSAGKGLLRGRGRCRIRGAVHASYLLNQCGELEDI